jgi:hypothetical protein
MRVPQFLTVTNAEPLIDAGHHFRPSLVSNILERPGKQILSTWKAALQRSHSNASGLGSATHVSGLNASTQR